MCQIITGTAAALVEVCQIIAGTAAAPPNTHTHDHMLSCASSAHATQHMLCASEDFTISRTQPACTPRRSEQVHILSVCLCPSAQLAGCCGADAAAHHCCSLRRGHVDSWLCGASFYRLTNGLGLGGLQLRSTRRQARQSKRQVAAAVTQRACECGWLRGSGAKALQP